MKDLAIAGWALLLDLASTIFFLVLYVLTRNIVLSVALGIAIAALQIGWRHSKSQRIDALQWVSLAIVVISGAATLLSRNPLFVMLKPTAIYILLGCAMLQKGWMLRYLPPKAMELVPDLALKFGYIWAGLMFFSAALNFALATHGGILTWGSIMSVWGVASKIALFCLQYTYMRVVGIRRYRHQTVA
jgi:intracellular septation protein